MTLCLPPPCRGPLGNQSRAGNEVIGVPPDATRCFIPPEHVLFLDDGEMMGMIDIAWKMIEVMNTFARTGGPRGGMQITS